MKKPGAPFIANMGLNALIGDELISVTLANGIHTFSSLLAPLTVAPVHHTETMMSKNKELETNMIIVNDEIQEVSVAVGKVADFCCLYVLRSIDHMGWIEIITPLWTCQLCGVVAPLPPRERLDKTNHSPTSVSFIYSTRTNSH